MSFRDGWWVSLKIESRSPVCSLTTVATFVSLVDPFHRSERHRKTLLLWEARGPQHQTGTDMVHFYLWLERNRPDLLDNWADGDPYHGLKRLLTSHTRGDSASG